MPYSGWTGGQLSVVRACAGLALGIVALVAGARWHVPETWAVAVLAVPFVVGAGDRWLALGLAALIVAPWRGLPPLPPQLALASWLVVHAALPAAPWGSLARRGRTDPGADWQVHPAVPWAGRVMLAATLLDGALRDDGRWLAAAWPAWLPLFALSLDPGWLRPRGRATETVFYDGGCGLCHGTVRFILAEDRAGAFRFAPLGGERFAAEVPAAARASLPDSLVVRLSDGRLLVRSDGMLHILARLGGGWRIAAGVGRVVPRPLRDAVYDGIARVRHRLFARPREVCPVVPPPLRARFDA